MFSQSFPNVKNSNSEAPKQEDVLGNGDGNPKPELQVQIIQDLVVYNLEFWLHVES